MTRARRPSETRQRSAVLAVFRSSPGPLTVEEILAMARETVPGLGIATVYRTLRLLREEERVQIVVMPSGETRFERAGLGHHHHFHCRTCDRVFDLEVCPVHLPDAALPAGFQVDGHELTLYGTCPGCAPT